MLYITQCTQHLKRQAKRNPGGVVHNTILTRHRL